MYSIVTAVVKSWTAPGPKDSIDISVLMTRSTETPYCFCNSTNATPNCHLKKKERLDASILVQALTNRLCIVSDDNGAFYAAMLCSHDGIAEQQLVVLKMLNV